MACGPAWTTPLEKQKARGSSNLSPGLHQPWPLPEFPGHGEEGTQL